jgi:hypothetical protein
VPEASTVGDVGDGRVPVRRTDVAAGADQVLRLKVVFGRHTETLVEAPAEGSLGGTGRSREILDRVNLVCAISGEANSGFQLDAAPEIAVSESWTDFFVGLLWRPKLGERWTFSGRFDVGAGGSDLVWNALAAIDYRLGKWAAVVAGYRYLDYDYKNNNNGVEVDMAMSGPVVAVRFFW